MRGLILIFLVVIALGAATGASASDPGDNRPPGPPSDVTCTALATGMTCFYPAHDR
jgi:hypothetical protein